MYLPIRRHVHCFQPRFSHTVISITWVTCGNSFYGCNYHQTATDFGHSSRRSKMYPSISGHVCCFQRWFSHMVISITWVTRGNSFNGCNYHQTGIDFGESSTRSKLRPAIPRDVCCIQRRFSQQFISLTWVTGSNWFHECNFQQTGIDFGHSSTRSKLRPAISRHLRSIQPRFSHTVISITWVADSNCFYCCNYHQTGIDFGHSSRRSKMYLPIRRHVRCFQGRFSHMVISITWVRRGKSFNGCNYHQTGIDFGHGCRRSKLCPPIPRHLWSFQQRFSEQVISLT